MFGDDLNVILFTNEEVHFYVNDFIAEQKFSTLRDVVMLTDFLFAEL